MQNFVESCCKELNDALNVFKTFTAKISLEMIRVFQMRRVDLVKKKRKKGKTLLKVWSNYIHLYHTRGAFSLSLDNG